MKNIKRDAATKSKTPEKNQKIVQRITSSNLVWDCLGLSLSENVITFPSVKSISRGEN